MALMQWDKTMSVGEDELDDQHQQLIILINEAYESIQRHDEHMMSELIDKMRDYARMHFSYEEELLRQQGYPDLDDHIASHDKFSSDVDEFQKNQFERTNLSQIFVYLSRWLTSHIMEEDMKFSSYLSKEDSEDQA